MTSRESAKLSSLTCTGCGSTLHGAEVLPKPASCFNDCLRRCEACGIGFSNGLQSQTLIYRDLLHNIPEQVRAGVEDALSNALNERNHPSKRSKFGFNTSEDALTWTVFTYLRTSQQVGRVFRSVGIADGGEVEPELLLWGVPQPPSSQDGGAIRKRLIEISDRLGETSSRRSEPDVIADFGQSGVAIVEVKYGAGNDQQRFEAKHEKYLDRTEAFSDKQLVRDSRMYELARNWRIGVELANGRPFTLVNLVVKSREAKQLAVFASGLNSRKGQFRVLTWKELANEIKAPDWLKRYLDEKL